MHSNARPHAALQAKEVDAFPPGTFSASAYLAEGGLGRTTKRTLWCVNVYSMNSSEACEQIRYIGGLPGQQEPGVVIELGNELYARPSASVLYWGIPIDPPPPRYIRSQGDPRFPNAGVYAEQMEPIVACAREHMPHARVAAVGAP